ncbi:MAG: hypothetical protein ACRCU2_01630, partial [Planktothrix sp.]
RGESGLNKGESGLNKGESRSSLELREERYFLGDNILENKLNGSELGCNKNYLGKGQMLNPSHNLKNHDIISYPNNSQPDNVCPNNSHPGNVYLYPDEDPNLIDKNNNFISRIPERNAFPLYPNDLKARNPSRDHFEGKQKIHEGGQFFNDDCFRGPNCLFDDEKFITKPYLQPPDKQTKSYKPKRNNPKIIGAIQTSCPMKDHMTAPTATGSSKDKYFTNSVKNLRTEDFVSVENLHHEITAAITNKDFSLSYVGLRRTMSIPPNDLGKCGDDGKTTGSSPLYGGLNSDVKEENIYPENGLNRKGSLFFEASILKVFKERKQIEEIFFNYGTIQKIDLIQDNQNELA